MAAADRISGAAAPHVHPRIEASALAPLLEQAGLVRPVVDVDRVAVRYPSLMRLVADLRAMGATNLLEQRGTRFLGKAARRRGSGIPTLGRGRALHRNLRNPSFCRMEARPLTVPRGKLLTTSP